jgi:hypothetical protein
MAQFDEDNTPRQLPERYRASMDPKDPEAHARLVENDAVQAERRQRFDTASPTSSAKDIHRSKALTTIQTLMAAGELTYSQREQFAEAEATLGNFNKAAIWWPERTELYQKYWDAVWLPDDEWCEHPDDHKYIKEYVWSVKEGCEMPMLACAICHIWNVLDAPQHLVSRELQQRDLSSRTKGMSIAEALRLHHSELGKRR